MTSDKPIDKELLMKMEQAKDEIDFRLRQAVDLVTAVKKTVVETVGNPTYEDVLYRLVTTLERCEDDLVKAVGVNSCKFMLAKPIEKEGGDGDK